MIKLMIADDQELIRESLKVVLDMNPDMEVIGLAENGRQLLELLTDSVPDVVLMDVRMPELDGVLCTKAVKEKYPKVKIIILTTFDDDEYVYNALKYGASGYLLKGGSMQELSSAIRAIGMKYVPVISQTLPSIAAGDFSAADGIRDLWNPPSLSVRLAAIHWSSVGR